MIRIVAKQPALAAANAAFSRQMLRRTTLKNAPLFLSQTSMRSFGSAANSTKKDDPFRGGFSLWYPVLGGLAITVAGGVKWGHDHLGGTEGLFRSISFYSYAIPKYIEYRYHMWKGSPDEVWDELDREASAMGLEKARELQGFYIKGGQMAASNLGGAFPEIWRDTLSVLQDECPAQDFKIIREIVDKELGFEKVFATFEEKPIGAASIGQVHRATLKDGTEVVVKVKYPRVEKLLRGDVRTIKAFAQVAQPIHVPPLDEMERQFLCEFDYREEAKHLKTVRNNLIKAGLEGKLCLVPKPYMDLCTESVLVMDELKGDKLAVALKSEAKSIAERQGESVEEFLKRQKQMEKEAKAEGDELRGPTSAEYDVLISIMDGQRRAKNAMKRLYNTSVGWMPGFQRREYEDKSVLPINHASMIDDLIYVHGQEVLVDGYFNGDPHPGNILLVRKADGTPQLGLIDYGSTKAISKKMRHLFCKLIIALAEDDREEIVRLTKEAGFKSKNMDPDVIYLYSKVAYDDDRAELTGGLHIQVFMEVLQSRDPIDQIPEEYILLSRSSLMIRGLAHALHQPRSIAKAWKPIAERVLREDL